MGVNIPSGVTKDMKEEGFVIVARGNRACWRGMTRRRTSGTRYAVYDLLKLARCVRWFVPGEFGEVVPNMVDDPG